MAKFIGRGRNSAKNIVKVKTKDILSSILAEYNYTTWKYGVKKWDVVSQALVRSKDGKKHYDMLVIRLPNRKSKTIYFDITSSFRKTKRKGND